MIATATEVPLTVLPKAAVLHGSTARLWRLRCPRRFTSNEALDARGVPRLGDVHPTDGKLTPQPLVVHALLPRRLPDGWEVLCLYRPGASGRWVPRDQRRAA